MCAGEFWFFLRDWVSDAEHDVALPIAPAILTFAHSVVMERRMHGRSTEMSAGSRTLDILFASVRLSIAFVAFLARGLLRRMLPLVCG